MTKPRKPRAYRTPEQQRRSVFGTYTKRTREPGEALGVQIPPMKLPVFDLHKHLAQRSGIAITS